MSITIDGLHRFFDITAMVTSVVVLFSQLFTLRGVKYGRHAINLSLLCIFSFLGFLFRVEWVYLQFDKIVGINNLSLLMSRIFLTLSIYVLVYDTGFIFSRTHSPWLKIIMSLSIFTYFPTFFLSVAHLPEDYYYGHTFTPSSKLSFLFYNSLYIYCAFAILFTVRTFLIFFSSEDILFARFRWAVSLTASVCSFLVLFVEALLVNNGYLYAITPFTTTILSISALFLKGAIIFWGVAFLPRRVYVALASLLVYLNKVQFFFNLVYLTTIFTISSFKISDLITGIRHLNTSIVEMRVTLLDFRWSVFNKIRFGNVEETSISTQLRLLLDFDDDNGASGYRQLVRDIKFSLVPRPSDFFLDMLKASSGLFWTLAYILIIRRGFQDSTFGMPVLALAANISWEFIFSFLTPHNKVQRTINLLWFALDVVIVYQYIFYTSNVSRLVCLIVSIVASIFIILLMYFKGDNKGIYSSLGQNLLMSVLFLFFLTREGLSGQSIYIALFKLLGTLIPSVAIYFWVRPVRTRVIKFLGISIFAFDFTYLVILYLKASALNINIWSLY